VTSAPRWMSCHNAARLTYEEMNGSEQEQQWRQRWSAGEFQQHRCWWQLTHSTANHDRYHAACHRRAERSASAAKHNRISTHLTVKAHHGLINTSGSAGCSGCVACRACSHHQSVCRSWHSTKVTPGRNKHCTDITITVVIGDIRNTCTVCCDVY